MSRCTTKGDGARLMATGVDPFIASGLQLLGATIRSERATASAGSIRAPVLAVWQADRASSLRAEFATREPSTSEKLSIWRSGGLFILPQALRCCSSRSPCADVTGGVAFLNSVDLRAGLQLCTLIRSSRRLRNAMVSAKPTHNKAYGRRYRGKIRRQPPRLRMIQGDTTIAIPSRAASTPRSRATSSLKATRMPLNLRAKG